MVTDWYELGLNDGWKGEKLTAFDGYQKNCNKYNVEPNRALYTKGRNEGLLSYCIASNGFRGNDFYTGKPGKITNQTFRGFINRSFVEIMDR